MWNIFISWLVFSYLWFPEWVGLAINTNLWKENVRFGETRTLASRDVRPRPAPGDSGDEAGP